MTECKGFEFFVGITAEKRKGSYKVGDCSPQSGTDTANCDSTAYGNEFWKKLTERAVGKNTGYYTIHNNSKNCNLETSKDADDTIDCNPANLFSNQQFMLVNA